MAILIKAKVLLVVAKITLIFETSFLSSCFSSLLFNKCVLIWLFLSKKLYLCGAITRQKHDTEGNSRGH